MTTPNTNNIPANFANISNLWMIDDGNGHMDSEHYPNEVVWNLCQNAKPSDFYFAMCGDDDLTMVAIVPKDYYNKEGCIFDQTLPIDHLLPDDFSESMESIWDSERNKDEVEKELLSLGFQKSVKFAEHVAEDYY